MARAYGIDISQYDVSYDPTPKVNFAIARASYGAPDRRSYSDPMFKNYISGLMKTPIRGAYHYMSSWGDWKEQADKFLSIVGNLNFDFYACDVETAFNVMSRNYAYMSMEWMYYVKQQTGKPVILYTSPSIYNDMITPYEKIRASTYPLWLAWYPYDKSKYDTQIPALPKGRPDWSIWQYLPGEDGQNGYECGVGRRGVDCNVFNGTLEDMQKWLAAGGGVPSVTPEPTPNVGQIAAKVTTYAINIRSAPSTGASVVGGLKQGDSIIITQTMKDTMSTVWGMLGMGKWIVLKIGGVYYTTWREDQVAVPPTVPQPPAGNPAIFKVTVGALNIRAATGISAPVVGSYTANSTFSLLMTITEGASVWGKISEGHYICLKSLSGAYYTTWREGAALRV